MDYCPIRIKFPPEIETYFGKICYPGKGGKQEATKNSLVKKMGNTVQLRPFFRALDERKIGGLFRDNFSYFSLKPYVLTPYLNHLVETVQKKGHNIRFYAELINKKKSLISSNTTSYLEL